MKTKNKKKIALLVLLLAHLMTIVDIFIVNIAIPSIQQGLGTTHSEIQLVIAMYMIGFASFLIIGGKAGDHYGRKNVFLLGTIIFMISSACCGFAATSEQLIALRFFQGVSAGLMSPQVLSYIQVLFTNHQERTYAIGWYGIAIGIGTMLGQFLGGFLIELKPYIIDQSWRYIFLINVPICIVTIGLANSYLKPSKDQNSIKMDYASAAILCIGLVFLIFSLTIGLEQDSNLYNYGLPVSMLFITGFVLRQKRRMKIQKQTLLNLTLFTFKNFNMAVVLVALFMLMLDAYFFVLALFLQDGLKLAPMDAGYFVVFQGGGFILSSLFAAKWVLRFGKNVLLFGVFLLIVALISQLVLFYQQQIGFTGYIIMTIHGFGVALVLPSFANIALKGIPENMIGNASGVYSTLQQLFGAIGIALTGGVFYSILDDNSDFTHFYKAFQYGLLLHLSCLIAVLCILIYLPKSVLPLGVMKNKKAL